MNFNFSKIDIELLLSGIWKNISPVYKKAFFISLIILNVAFGFYIISFLPDNHYLNYIKEKVPLNFSMYNGRYASTFLLQIFDGNLFPIILHLFSFTGFILSLIYLLKYWELPKTIFISTIFILFTILLPYSLPWFYYLIHTTNFWALFAITLGLYILTRKNLFCTYISAVLFLYSYGVYFGNFQTLLIIFLGKCLFDAYYLNLSLTELIKENKHILISICLSFAIYVGIILYLDYTSVLRKTVQTSITFDITAEKFKYMISSFYKPIPFLSTEMRCLLLVPFFIVLLDAIYHKKLLSLFIIFAILSTTQIINFLNYPYSNIVRIHFYVWPWFYALFIAMLLKRGKLIYKNVALVILLISINYSVIQDLKWEKGFVFSIKREITEYDKVIHRIKENLEFDPNRIYTVILVGRPSYRKFFNEKVPKTDRANYIYGGISDVNPKYIFDFWEKKSYINKVFDDINKIVTQENLNKDFIIKKAKIWPSKDSILIEKDMIYLFFSQEQLDALRKQLK